MRVGVVHSFYREDIPSGENVAVRQQVDALLDAGIEVVEFFRWTDSGRRRVFYPVVAAGRVATGFDASDPLGWVEREKPDLLHVHNLFPNFGSRWLSRVTVPVVSTVHNFRFACANGLLFRDGRVCTECVDSGSRRSLKHACYRNSRAATIPLALATRGGASGSPQLNATDIIVTQAQRPHRFLIDQGIGEERLRLIPGFVESANDGVTPAPQVPRFVFVGRDSPEKGLSELLRRWPRELPLHVVGASGARDSQDLGQGVEFVGVKERSWIRKQLPHYTALVFPGRVWEGAYPLVVREALEAGIPIVALAGSGAEDLVNASGAGTVYTEADAGSLDAALTSIVSSGDDIRVTAREFAVQELGKEAWTSRMLECFAEALSRRRRRLE